MVLFGAGRVGRLGKDLGTSVKEFRRAMRDDEDAPPPPYVTTEAQAYVPQYPQVAAPLAPAVPTGVEQPGQGTEVQVF